MGCDKIPTHELSKNFRILNQDAKIVVIVPLVYIVIVISMAKNIDVKENENKVKEHVLRSEQSEEENEMVESLDTFVPN